MFMEKEYVSTKIEREIARIEFFHPRANSMPLDLLHSLADEIDNASKKENVRVILLKSAGEKTFCAGASFTDLEKVKNMQEAQNFFFGFARVINSIRESTKIVVGRSQGKAVGGGVGILSSCDFVFATEKSEIKLSELAIGIGPFVIAPAVERKIGVANLGALTLDPETWKSAQWCREKGLYNRVFETIEQMDKELDMYLEKMASYRKEALVEIKKLLWKDTQNWGELLYENAKISAKLWMK